MFLNEDKLAAPGGNRFICSPPLRPEDNVSKLRGLALSGHFDVFATDHCAFRKKDKDHFFADIPGCPERSARYRSAFRTNI
ncbi:MAG: hypothetical protein AB2L26_07295 [Ignavibacteria bacterium]